MRRTDEKTTQFVRLFVVTNVSLWLHKSLLMRGTRRDFCPSHPNFAYRLP